MCCSPLLIRSTMRSANACRSLLLDDRCCRRSRSNRCCSLRCNRSSSGGRCLRSSSLGISGLLGNASDLAAVRIVRLAGLDVDLLRHDPGAFYGLTGAAGLIQTLTGRDDGRLSGRRSSLRSCRSRNRGLGSSGSRRCRRGSLRCGRSRRWLRRSKLRRCSDGIHGEGHGASRNTHPPGHFLVHGLHLQLVDADNSIVRNPRQKHGVVMNTCSQPGGPGDRLVEPVITPEQLAIGGAERRRAEHPVVLRRGRLRAQPLLVIGLPTSPN